MSKSVDSNALSRRNFAIGGVLLAAVGLTTAFIPRKTAARLSDSIFDGLFPREFGEWRYLTASGLVLPPSDELSRTLYEQLLTRTYQASDGTLVMLLLAYSSVQEGRLQVHRPEVCYPAAGYTLVENIAHDIPLTPSFSLPTRFILAENNGRNEYLVYWTRVGPSLPARWFDQRIAMAEENLKGRIPDGMLARISTIATDSVSAMRVLDRFTRDLTSAANPHARHLLIGEH